MEPVEIRSHPELLAADFRFRGSVGVTTRGCSTFREYVAMIRAAFPDFHNLIESMLADENRVVARLQYTATHRGKIFDVEPTGNHISYPGVAIFSLGGHRLLSGWVLADRYELMPQLGAITEPS